VFRSLVRQHLHASQSPITTQQGEVLDLNEITYLHGGVYVIAQAAISPAIITNKGYVTRQTYNPGFRQLVEATDTCDSLFYGRSHSGNRSAIIILIVEAEANRYLQRPRE